MVKLADASVEAVLSEESRHIAIVGKFSLEDSVITYPAGKLRGPNFELLYERNTWQPDGKQEELFEGFRVICPCDYEPVDGKDKPNSLPLADTPLEDELARGETEARTIGGRLFVELLDLLDKIMPFWHPNFDRLLTEGFCFFVEHVESKREEAVMITDVRAVAYRASVNRALLSFLRGNASEAKAFFEECEKEGNSAQATALREGAQRYKRALVSDTGGPREAPDFADVLNTNMNWQAYIAAQPIPTRSGASLVELYRQYVTTALRLDQLTKCEPLIAMMIVWYFSKISSGEAGQVAQDLFEKLYKENKLWRPRLSSEELAADEATFEALLKTRYAQLVKGEKKGERSSAAILYRNYMREMIEYRRETWRIPRRYTRGAIVADTVTRLLALAAERVPELQKTIQEGKTALDELGKSYRAFEAIAGEHLTIESLSTALKEQGVPADMEQWLTAFREQHGKLKGADLTAAFKESFNTKVAELQDERIAAFIAKEGGKIDQDLELLKAIYMTQLQGGVDNVVGLVEGGSHLGVRRAEESGQKTTQTQSGHGAQPLYRRLLGQVAQTYGGGPAGDSAERVKSESAQNSGDAEKESEEAPKTSGQAPPPADPPAAQTKAGRSDFPFFLDIEEAQLKGADDNADRREKRFEHMAERLDAGDRALEDLRAELLAGGLGAASRGLLRAVLLGEFFLGGVGSMSPLEKNDTSLGVAILLEMVEHIGASRDYEDPNRRLLLHRDARGSSVDPKCGALEVNLPNFWQTGKGPAEAVARLKVLVNSWLRLASGVLGLRSYIEDMREVRRLVDALRGDDRLHLTLVNETLLKHVKTEHPFFSVPLKGAEPPVGVVYLTRQAFARAHTRSLVDLEARMLRACERLRELGKEEDRAFSLPVIVTRGVARQWWPTLETDVAEAWTLVDVLRVGATVSATETLGPDAPRMQALTGIPVGPQTHWATLWKRWLGGIEPMARLIVSKVVSHALFQKSRGVRNAAVRWQESVYEGVQTALRVIDPADRQVTVAARKVGGPEWITLTGPNQLAEKPAVALAPANNEGGGGGKAPPREIAELARFYDAL
jgi:hypothetical protein